MFEPIALLAVSQLMSFIALIYLYTRLQAATGRREIGAGIPVAAPAREAPSLSSGRPGDAVAAEGGRPDVAALARRVGRSEEEVRLLLRRQRMTR